MGTRLPWPEVIVTALVIAAGAGLYAWAHRDEAALEESKRRGAELVQALHSYHREHGTYPPRLQDLTPDYVAAVEPPTWGLERWRYRIYTAEQARAQPRRAGRTTDDARPTPTDQAAPAHADLYFQLSVAADESGYPVLYYDFATQRWVLNN